MGIVMGLATRRVINFEGSRHFNIRTKLFVSTVSCTVLKNFIFMNLYFRGLERNCFVQILGLCFIFLRFFPKANVYLKMKKKARL